jgi:mannosyltransferase OCH1-like enzyme
MREKYIYACVFLFFLVICIYCLYEITKIKLPKVIPLTLYTTWHTKELPSGMKEAYEWVKSENPEFKVELYDENDCREFIRLHFDERTLKAYDCLRPQAYKSDLWRYCVLYKNGGIYYDIKFVPENNFKFIELTDKEYFVEDLYKRVVNGIIAVKKGHPLLKKAIEDIVKKVETKDYGQTYLDVTGPGLLKTFFTEKEIDQFELELENENHIIYIRWRNGKRILGNYPSYRKEQSDNGKGDHYAVLWQKRDVFSC